MKWAETCFELIQAIRREPFVFQRLAGAFTTGFYILHVRTHNLWSVRIQAPVRFEWAIKLRVPLPVSNYSERFCPPLRFCKGLFATVNSFEPHNSLPHTQGLACLLPGEQRLSSGSADWGPVTHSHPSRGLLRCKRKRCPLPWSLLSQTLDLPSAAWHTL